MKPEDQRRKNLWGIIMVGLLTVTHWLGRFYFFGQETMKQWPSLFTAVGIFVIVFATVRQNRIISLTTVVGYVVGFILALYLKEGDQVPAGGGASNPWIIWGAVFAISILIGMALSFIKNQRAAEES